MRNIKLGFGWLILFLLVFGLAFSWRTWKTEKENQTRYLASIGELAGKSLDTYFSQFEGALYFLGQQLLDEDGIADPVRIDVLLKRFHQANPNFHAINLLNPAGQILATTAIAAGNPLPFVGNSQSFIRARDALQKGENLNLGQPSVGLMIKEWGIPVRFAVRDKNNTMRYILHAALPLNKQQTFWQNLYLQHNTVIGVLRDDGFLLTVYPAPREVDLSEVYGVPRAGALIDFLQKNSFPQRGLVEGSAGLVQSERIFAFHRLSRYPLTLFVTAPLSNVQTSWWQQAQYPFLLMFLLLAGSFGIFRWTLKRQIAWEREREHAGRTSRLAASAMENTIEGIMITDADRRVVSVNNAFIRITGYTAEEAIGKTPKMFSSGQHDDVFYDEMWRSLHEAGYWQGEILDRRKNGEIYAELLSMTAVRANNRDVTHYVGVFNDISQYKDYEARLEFLSNHDPLTRLPNRVLLHDRLEEAIGRAKRHDELVCVIFIDLDQFKVINDSLGHAIGDKLLQEATLRLLANVRESDTVGRLGGDEFAVILEPLRNTDEAMLIAQQLLEAVATPMQIEEHQLYISGSIGISVYPQDGSDVPTLLKHADTAMYRAKEEGRNKYKFFSADMNERAHEFMVMANNLHAALEKNELFLEYQPRIDLASGKLVGVEALLRWNHPALGHISPDKFIPLAEETGLIIPIGEWVILAACRQGKTWIDAGYPLRMAVNLSVRQFRKQGLVGCILDAARETGFPLTMLEIEITESLMMHDPRSVEATLEELSSRGIRIAIDDFGTGYSSLNYLKQFPIDYVKIDKSFVKDIPADRDSVAIVRTIIAMAKNLRLSLIAEGVETRQQYDLLRAEGCEEAQGHYFSRSIPASGMEQCIAEFGIVPELHLRP